MNPDHLLSSYDYHLPEELIAQRPRKGKSRLLHWNRRHQTIDHRSFPDLLNLLPPHTVIVRNTSKVYPARILIQKQSGAKGELLLLSPHLITTSYSPKPLVKAWMKIRGPKKPSTVYELQTDHRTITLEYQDQNNEKEYYLSIHGIETQEQLNHFLEQYALLPIPPYIRQGKSDSSDTEDYQCVYASPHEAKSLAAPTAGLHFSSNLLSDMEAKGHTFVDVYLHVGIGTFQPVKTEDIRKHPIHSEAFSIPHASLNLLFHAFHQGPILVIGTTTFRALETLWRYHKQHPGDLQSFIHQGKDFYGETSLFLYPQETPRLFSDGLIMGLITNFHLPQSTLLMMISSLVGRQELLKTYALAIEEKYRFFSYGDAMFIDFQ